MPNSSAPLARADSFCLKYQLKLPILLAPMAGACPVSLSIAVANAGSMGALGALMSKPDAIRAWVQEFRSKSSGPLQLNTWIPDPAPSRDAGAEARMRAFLAAWGPAVPTTAGDVVPRISARNVRLFSKCGPQPFPRSWGYFHRNW